MLESGQPRRGVCASQAHFSVMYVLNWSTDTTFDSASPAPAFFELIGRRLVECGHARAPTSASPSLMRVIYPSFAAYLMNSPVRRLLYSHSESWSGSIAHSFVACSTPTRNHGAGASLTPSSLALLPLGIMEREHRSLLRRLLYSHSMVPGGLLVTSSTTRFTSRTSFVMRVEMRAITSYGSRDQSAVIASSLDTGRSTIGCP